MSGQQLALAIGNKVHIAQKLAAGNFATSNILLDPDSLHPEESGDSVQACSLDYYLSDARLLVAYQYHGVICWSPDENIQLWKIISPFKKLGCASLLLNAKHLLVSDFEGGQAHDEPLGTTLLNDGSHACGSFLGRLTIWSIKRTAVSQVLEIDQAPVKAVAVFHVSEYFGLSLTITT
ncbi:hypothetical protein BDQ17DRAFT_1334474 [Cyathus striatus]|nr:hypothetical protein BDQ17DRAFT_1334474 [Cyathus striatus]